MITSSLMKSLLFCLTILLQLVNISSGIGLGFVSKVPGFFSKVPRTQYTHSYETINRNIGREFQTAPKTTVVPNNLFKQHETSPRDLYNPWPQIMRTKQPGTRRPVPKRMDSNPSFGKAITEIILERNAREFGERLAKRYFGRGGKEGFRWGYRQGKRIHAIARKCKDFTEALKNASCPQPVQVSNPLPNSEIVTCIVEVANLGSGACLPPAEKTQYPPEANCTLSMYNKIDPNYCNPIA